MISKQKPVVEFIKPTTPTDSLKKQHWCHVSDVSPGQWAAGAPWNHRRHEGQEWRSSGCDSRCSKQPGKRQRFGPLTYLRYLHQSVLFFNDLTSSPLFPDLQMRRQNSCESISSLNSLTSMSSIGSLKDQDAKKKKKKSWVRSAVSSFSLLSRNVLFCINWLNEVLTQSELEVLGAPPAEENKP